MAGDAATLDVLVKLNVAIPLIVIAAGTVCNIRRLQVRSGRALPQRCYGWLTLVGSLACLVLSIVLVLASPADPLDFSIPVPLLGQMDFYVDALSIYFLLLVNLIAAFASWHELVSQKNTARPVYFNTFVNLFHFTMLMVPVVDNLIMLWIAVEATTLVSTLLVSYLDQRNSWEAAWKYLLITSTGIIFGLLGTMFLANAAQGLLEQPGVIGLMPNNPNQVMNWSLLVQNTDYLAPKFMMLSFLFILVGYGTKAGFAPMHTWLPDGHGEAPAPISALLSGVLLKSALYAILRFSTLTNKALGDGSRFTCGLLLGVGLVSLVLATPFILNERNRFKRVLAYHSLEHMGIIAFGLGIGGNIALFGALLHTLNHALTKSLMFLSFGVISDRSTSQVAGQKAIGNVLTRMPIIGIFLAVGGLALVGTPPFNIFLSELIILWGALAPAASIWPQLVIAVAVFLFLISTTLIFYGLIRHLARVLLSPPTSPAADAAAASSPGGALAAAQPSTWQETGAEALPLLLMTVLVVLSGLLMWEPLAAVLDQSVGILQGA